MYLATLVNLIIGIAVFVVSITAMIISAYEKETRASIWSLICALSLPVPFLLPAFIPAVAGSVYPVSIIIITSLVLLAFLCNPKQKKFAPVKPTVQHDERETMFSRRELEPGSKRYQNYYTTHPEHHDPDKKWRQKPGLLDPDSLFYHPVSFAAAEASFETIGQLGPFIDGPVKKGQQKLSAKDLTHFIKKWMLKQGMADIGVTEMQPYHYYHTKGRGSAYNQAITPQHKYGIALTVEMDESMINAAPKGSAVMESAEKYLKSGVPAVQLATFLREMGYDAKAHIDGNYELICPLVARDAALGEIGRMGLLMTPGQGPRVRIAVVTTNAPLVLSKPASIAYSMNEFCTYCKKCAAVCPGQAISFDERKVHDGVLRWKINSESCFTYWQTAGTDCGRCMAVCPYAHANNLLHNAVRSGIRYSKLFRRVAVILDDLFYGKRPGSKSMPHWIPQAKS